MGKHSEMLVFKLRDLYHVPLGQRVVFPDNQIEVSRYMRLTWIWYFWETERNSLIFFCCNT